MDSKLTTLAQLVDAFIAADRPALLGDSALPAWPIGTAHLAIAQ